MGEKHPVIAVTGTEEQKKEIEYIQKKLTNQGYIIVSIGTYGKETLDMRMDKIDMAEELFVINPMGTLEETIWADICYAYLTGKDISSLESLSYREIQEKAKEHIFVAEELAKKQAGDGSA